MTAMASMRRTASNEKAKVAKPAESRPEVVVHDPVPRPDEGQRWTLASYPFYEPPTDPKP